MLLQTRDFILSKLDELALSDFAARPYDCSFGLLAAPPTTKKLIMVGFNGSIADAIHTNAGAVHAGFEDPAFSNVALGLEGGWGPKTLAKRLTRLPGLLGFDWQETVYTNSLLLCSPDAASINKAARQSPLGSLAELTRRSMDFFEQVTVPLCEPELIIAYSNSLQAPSAGKILWESFGVSGSMDHVDTSAYYATYGFTALVAGRQVPVVGIRHLSRFDFGHEGALVKTAWERQRSKAPSPAGAEQSCA
ncbi:hypothetical protein [Pseudomonas sp. Marseille-Q5115]|uniref:hypothetical protein n=1 Tax=Pseudomonas sp. Marseille-Q5115 TaxID=2866593 RepID=UPI001CE43A4E|nr:hypothetical protein [Pseudomonas sp. Marseille-Q5115]